MLGFMWKYWHVTVMADGYISPNESSCSDTCEVILRMLSSHSGAR